MAGQIPADTFAGSLSDPGIDPFEVPEAPPQPPPSPAGQEHVSAKPVPGPISPNNKLQPESMYSRMRSGVLGALGLDNPLLNTPVPNPAYSPQLNQTADKVLGAIQNPASVYPPKLQNAANKLQQGIAAATGWIDPQAKDIAGMLLGSVFPEKEAGQALWGGAKFAMKGPMEFEPWAADMRQDAAAAGRNLDETRLPKMYEKSKGLYEANVAKAPLSELSEKHLPNLQNIVDQYNAGHEGADWYLNTRPELERQFGDDTDLFINLLAATSPNNTVPANLTQALKAYKAYKNNVPFELVHPGWMKSQITNMYRAVNGQPLQGQKIINFAKNLKGETEPVTIDRWMMRALGMPNAPIGTNTYKFADYWLSQIAHDMGVEPRQLQAAVWKTAREVGGESASTGQPFESMLQKRLAGDPALNSLLSGVRRGAAQDIIRQAPTREQMLTSLLPKWKKTAPTPTLGTMEVATRQTPSGETAANLYDRLGGMDQSQPWVQDLKRGYEGAQQSAFDALAMPQGKQPSLISQLRSAITGNPKSIDDTIATRGTAGTFGNEINPNIQFSMEGMSEPERHAMLSILGQHFKQAASAASHFDAIPKTDPMYANPDTYSVFLHSHPDLQTINQFANHIGFPVNVRQYSNGTMLDLNTGGMNTKPALHQVEDAAQATFGEQRRAIFPRRYSGDYIPQEQYQEKINGHLQQGPHAGTEEAAGPASGLPAGAEHIPRGAGRPGRTGNPPQSLSNIRAQIEAVAKARDEAFEGWARETQARLKALGYARGGAVIDGGWYGQNAPGPLRLGYADGGVADTLFGTGPLPPDPSVSAVPAAVQDYFKPQPLTPETVVGSFSSNQDPFSAVRAMGQGLANPIYSLAQVGTTLPGLMTDAQRADVMKAINEQQEDYEKGIPGGKLSHAAHELLSTLTGVATFGELQPELPAALGKAGIGALEGALWGGLDPEKGEGPFSVQEKLRQMGTGAVAGSIMHPAGHTLEEKVLKPAAAKVAPWLAKHTPWMRQAAQYAGENALEPKVEAAEHGGERLAEQEAAAQSPFLEKLGKRIFQSLDDVVRPNPQNAIDWMQKHNNSPDSRTPGLFYSGGGLYGQLRSGALRSIKNHR